MIKIFHKIIYFWIIGIAIGCCAQDPVKFSLDQSGIFQGQMLLNFKLAPGWKMYGPRNQDVGFPPKVVWHLQENIQDVQVEWPREGLIEDHGEKIWGYKGAFQVPINFKIINPHQEAKLEGALTYLICSQSCIPMTEPLDITILPSGKEPALFWTMMAFAFLGGMILNLMPCVLPVLSLKLFSLLKIKNKESKAITKQFLILSLGSLTFFLSMGLMIALFRYLGMTVGWGMHFQNPYFLIAFLIILTLFLARLWGLLHFDLPGAHYLSTHAQSRYFLEGLFAALLATPCTAPFLGTAAGFSLSQPFLETMAIFLALGLGFTLPYVLLAFSPKLINLILPKPGKWMITLEKILGGLVLISILWLLWVLKSSMGMEKMIGVGLLLIGAFGTLWMLKRLGVTLILMMLTFMIPFWGQKIEVSSQPPIARLIQKAIDQKETVFLEITAAWCLTCHANQPLLKSSKVEKLFQDHHVKHYTIDWTLKDEEVAKFLKDQGRAGIPFYMMVTPQNPQGAILPEILTYRDLEEALHLIKFPIES
jgi:suppressor for copper-sensitivity B